MNHNLGETQHLDKKTAINVKDEKFGATIQGGGGLRLIVYCQVMQPM